MNEIMTYTVPTKAVRTTCKRCGRRIYLVNTVKFTKAIDCTGVDMQPPTDTKAGKGIEHAKVCPAAHRGPHMRSGR